VSYARFSHCDVYVYMDVNGSLACCGCHLGDDWYFGSTEAMVAHLAEHRAAGHDVPDGLEDALRADDAENFPPRHTDACLVAVLQQFGYVPARRVPKLDDERRVRGERLADTTPHVCICTAGLDPAVLEVGAGATIRLDSDTIAATIAEVHGKRIGVRQDHQERTDKNGPYAGRGQQVWKTEPNPDAPIEWYSIRKSGRIVAVGWPDRYGEVTLYLGGRNPFRDPTA